MSGAGMHKFHMTQEAMQEAIKLLGAGGFLQLNVMRLKDDSLQLSLSHNGVVMYRMDAIKLPGPGDYLTIEGLKVQLDLELPHDPTT